jgi:hypothetical protein
MGNAGVLIGRRVESQGAWFRRLWDGLKLEPEDGTPESGRLVVGLRIRRCRRESLTDNRAPEVVVCGVVVLDVLDRELETIHLLGELKDLDLRVVGVAIGDRKL